MAQTAVIAGVGPGLGASLARTFAAEGCHMGLFARSRKYIEQLATEIENAGGTAHPVQTDITHQDDVSDAFAEIRDVLGPVDILVNHPSKAYWKSFDSLKSDEFRTAWEVAALGAFHCSSAVVSDMREAGGGTILFSGATSAIRGRANATAFSSAKFAVRGLAESMARELGPDGIHVAHVVIDGQILTPSAREEEPDRDNETFLDPDAIAETYWHLVEQDRSSWTLELDVRPHVEEF